MPPELAALPHIAVPWFRYLFHIALYYVFIALMMQVRDSVDKQCRISDSQKTRTRDSDKPIVCSEIDGADISNQSKRDVGMMLDVIITYKNK
jgi:hypothetical protein